MTIAEVQQWGRTIGAVLVQEGTTTAAFEYMPEFLRSGIELSPLHMPLQPRIYSFPELAQPAFHGLPGLLADSLPDRFGNGLSDQWLAMQGRSPQSFNAVERLCYTGARGCWTKCSQPSSSGLCSGARQAWKTARSSRLARSTGVRSDHLMYRLPVWR